MPLKSWLARLLITRAARAYGFLDPIGLLAKMRGFSQPSEVGEPVELLRAGMIFHARGLINTKAIQNNLDWIWPYWVERQFNPNDDSFIPRAFSFSHINLTHRNWTAVGRPDVPYYPIVDPRGLVTPLFDGWSVDLWWVSSTGIVLGPSKLADFTQALVLDDNLHVHSVADLGQAVITSDVDMCLVDGRPQCCVTVSMPPGSRGFVAVAIRPYNPEGVSFIDHMGVMPDGLGFLVNRRNPVTFDRAPARLALSIYKDGDVWQHLQQASTASDEVTCEVGMATGAALFDAASVASRPLELRMPIYDEIHRDRQPRFATTVEWGAELAGLSKMRIADATMQRLFDHAVANVVLHSPDEVFPGPYTYKRFWFRDAVFILNALLALGGVERVRRAMKGFAPRQRRDGYFLSQEGEWDSNGEALWMYHRFAVVTGEALPDEWIAAVAKGARWIKRKRLPTGTRRPEAGLLPAGFSAEHLGPNDFYYWDDFWGVAGLRSAAALLQKTDSRRADEFTREADDFLATIERSVPSGPQRRFPGAWPASPKRRMDAGAVGSLVADYPLQLFPPADRRIVLTADYLRDHSSFEGGFFQNMIHSGINPYLTMHLAQVRLRAGQAPAAWALIDCVAALASPTGQWPEAIHPRTGGGCMGDGQHIWAAAEWTFLLRNCFVREEPGRLVIGSGVRPEWWREGGAFFGPTLTAFGTVTVRIVADGDGANVLVDAKWRGEPPSIDVVLPGFIASPGAHGAVHHFIPAP
ncbi:MAG: hypothetical protein JWM35_1966 [Verrucomicrobia bacterium]|nr:hypothetical protein [Verrucomicrobiota bacterium]